MVEILMLLLLLLLLLLLETGVVWLVKRVIYLEKDYFVSCTVSLFSSFRSECLVVLPWCGGSSVPVAYLFVLTCSLAYVQVPGNGDVPMMMQDPSVRNEGRLSRRYLLV
jgi:hypothetical protein